MRTLAALFIFMLLGLLLAGCSSSAKESGSTEWPAPPNPMELARKAGLEPETAESLQHHVHAHLDVFKDGKKIVVPPGIGIDINNPAVKKQDDALGGYPAYGSIDPPCNEPCISPLHTHYADGVMHTESATQENNTFGQFLTEWDVTLPSDAKVYVDGQQFSGDPGTIELTDHREIAVVIGKAPASIPSSYDFG